MAVAQIDAHRWTREEYERMAEAGVFHPSVRVELVDGIVYDMTPQNSYHAAALHKGLAALQRAFPSGFYVRVQVPLSLADDSAPEPDLAVVAGSIDDHLHAHPATALLVFEVADSSLLHDRKRKLPVYAQAGIPETWILNLRDQRLEVYRDPIDRTYRYVTFLGSHETVSPLDRPDASIWIADLLSQPRSAE